ncbi:aldose 1-epimerase [Teichococcus cervicalis]|uniref:Aldose 1-epimerase n=1 Tax=Pseudoroseomonas cervicalis ATCC 49957 TaxID=525371 RepID=D5RN06_9PROT|nr:aldose 1-epimerase [Pseudoroseomonas cervicalis]EFH11306.1 aldose 1-epimerase [Pseudoroseomonas cervicalis ATCC 49957]
MRQDGIELRHGAARLRLALTGAEPRSWQVGGQELLWPGDAASWPQSAPVLFPTVGWCRGAEIRHRGQAYPMGVHGFAAAQPFRLLSHRADSALLLLQDSAATRRHFPFAFRLALRYRITDDSLSVGFRLDNPGDEALPYALGLHPGFLWDPAQPGQSLRFSAAETPSVPVIAPGGLFSARRRPVPLQGRVLPLSPALLAEEALCFLHLDSRSVLLDRGAAGRLRLRLWDFPHLALWSLPGAGFLCLEAWTGHGDPEDFAGEITEKPSMRLLPPGGTARHRLRFEALPPRG